MIKFLIVMLLSAVAAQADDLPTKKYIDLGAIKTMVAGSEAKAKELNVSVTICVVDESGNLLFLEKGETASISTIEWAQKKARHSAFFGSPSKDAADTIKKGNVEALAFPLFFPNQGGLPNQSRWQASRRNLCQRCKVGDRRTSRASRSRCAFEEVTKESKSPASA